MLLQEKRNDREVEGLFTALLHTAEIRDSSLPKAITNSRTNLPALRKHLVAAQQVFLDVETQLAAPDQWVSAFSTAYFKILSNKPYFVL